MLRLLWGESAKEKLQHEEILRLRAQLSDLQAAYTAQGRAHTTQLQDAYTKFLGFLRPSSTTPDVIHSAPEARQYPGERPDTAPAYPDKPLWAKSEIKTAGGDS